MSFVILIGRILLGLIFVGSGFGGHLIASEDATTYAALRGVKGSAYMVRLSGVSIALAGLGVILGVWIDLAALAIVAYSLIAAFAIHHFWTDDDEMTRSFEMSMFMKNVSIAGGALILFAFTVAADAALGLTITGPVFSFDL